MTYLDILRIQLPLDEGARRMPYVDTVGKVTIGIGRNLTDVGIGDDEQNLMFENDLSRAVAVCHRVIPTFDSLNDVRKAVVVNMAFNLAMGLAGFKDFLKAISEERWADAASAMLDSRWAKEVPSRALRLAKHMRDGI